MLPWRTTRGCPSRRPTSYFSGTSSLADFSPVSTPPSLQPGENSGFLYLQRRGYSDLTFGSWFQRLRGRTVPTRHPRTGWTPWRLSAPAGRASAGSWMRRGRHYRLGAGVWKTVGGGGGGEIGKRLSCLKVRACTEVLHRGAAAERWERRRAFACCGVWTVICMLLAEAWEGRLISGHMFKKCCRSLRERLPPLFRGPLLQH